MMVLLAFAISQLKFSSQSIHVFLNKKLVHKKLVLRWPKFQETLVLCLRSAKKLFKVDSMNFIANRSLNLYYWAILSNHLCFHHNRTLFIPIRRVLNIKKHICSSVSDHIDNSCIQKVRNQLRNF